MIKNYLLWYMVQAIDVGPALTENILNSNGDLVHRYAYCSLHPKEVNYYKELRCQFYVMIE